MPIKTSRRGFLKGLLGAAVGAVVVPSLITSTAQGVEIMPEEFDLPNKRYWQGHDFEQDNKALLYKIKATPGPNFTMEAGDWHCDVLADDDQLEATEYAMKWLNGPTEFEVVHVKLASEQYRQRELDRIMAGGKDHAPGDIYLDAKGRSHGIYLNNEEVLVKGTLVPGSRAYYEADDRRFGYAREAIRAGSFVGIDSGGGFVEVPGRYLDMGIRYRP